MRAGSLPILNLSDHGWFFRYKLYHLPFWFVYHYLWWTITIGNPWQVANNIFFSFLATKFFFSLVFQALGVYFNLYHLIPRFLEKGKYLQYVTLLFITIVGSAAFITSGYYVGAVFSGRPFIEVWGVDPENYLHFFKNNSLPSTVASMTLAMSIKLTKNWIQTKRREQMLEREKLETELKFLKSQFNPHFLFNTINSIFVLIHKNPNMASEALSKFSDLLRYQLYECNEAEIPLEQELTYLENYIELEKLRRDANDLKLTLELASPPTPDLVIAPFVLIPFVENAFKHVPQQKNKLNWITMALRFDHHQLHFTIANSISAKGGPSREFMKHGGIGLKNVQRRLDLIYPGEHTLTIDKCDDEFCVTLFLNLHKHKITAQTAMQIGY